MKSDLSTGAMVVTLARHFGMCFGVRDALELAREAAGRGPATVLGELVHNPVVTERLRALGVGEGRLEDPPAAGDGELIVTAHGTSDSRREALQAAGHRVTDTTCPLVRKAHRALRSLVEAGYFPVVIGRKGHVEVKGLTGDFPEAVVVESEADLDAIPVVSRIGVISQTTQPVARVRDFVAQIERGHPEAEVRFIDTVCQPTRDRQTALEDLCRWHAVVVVVGGRHSNNTGELAATARGLGATVHRVESAGDIDPDWFRGVRAVGVTAGTSTLEETVHEVVDFLRGL